MPNANGFLFEIYVNAKEQQLTAYLRRFSSAADLARTLVSDHSPVPESTSNAAIVYVMLPIRYVRRRETPFFGAEMIRNDPRQGVRVWPLAWQVNGQPVWT